MVSTLLTTTGSSFPSTSMLSVLKKTASHILSPPSDEEEDGCSWELEASPTLVRDSFQHFYPTVLTVFVSYPSL